MIFYSIRSNTPELSMLLVSQDYSCNIPATVLYYPLQRTSFIEILIVSINLVLLRGESVAKEPDSLL
jgi:hypothetical protein